MARDTDLLDLDEAETATVLGWPRGTVKPRLHRALHRLSEVLPASAATDRPTDSTDGKEAEREA